MKKEILSLSRVGGQQHQSLGASFNGGMFCILSLLESLIYKQTMRDAQKKKIQFLRKFHHWIKYATIYVL